MKRFITALVGLCIFCAPAHAQEARNLVLVTIDGFRWQELFRGADPDLVADPRYRARYVDTPDRPAALAPFLLSFAQEGALIGDRDKGSCARVTNDFWFSYPGYAEMLAGRPNPKVRSNQATPNDDVTVLERLAARPEFAGQVHVFAEWTAVPAILNVARSKLSVFVARDQDAPHDPQVDAAARAMFAELPRVMWVEFGDTDHDAHGGDYEGVLAAASNADLFLRDLWQAIEADPRMARKTTLIVTADHGRGGSRNGRWKGHGSGRWRGIVVPGLRREGSEAVFIAVRGPDIAPTSAYSGGACATTSQIAATILKSLKLESEIQPDMAPPLAIFR
jgi:hypothetical protein